LAYNWPRILAIFLAIFVAKSLANCRDRLSEKNRKRFGKEKRQQNQDSTNGHRYVFDDFEIDPANRLCLRAGHPVPLTARVFDILVVFAENPGRLLKKNELIANVWHEEFVEEANLSRNISTLRRALGDGSNGHKYIVTVPGHGYRFVATVAEVAAPVPESAPGEEIKPPRQMEAPAAAALPAQKLRGFQLGQKTAFVMILFAVVGAVVYLRWAGKLTFGKASKAAILFENIKLRNLTNSGDVYAPVISPDGKYLAYSSGPKLRVRQLASGRVIEIPTPITSPGVRYWAVLFSADSNYVYFTIADDGENISGTLFRVPVLGGRAEKILDHVNSGGHESPDGKHLVFVRADVNAGKSYLMISNTDGTNQQSISTIDMIHCLARWTGHPIAAEFCMPFANTPPEVISITWPRFPLAAALKSGSSSPVAIEFWRQNGFPVKAD
jgi:DNA-binding winged helix-turn-helix (wHTH) protein